MPGTTQPTFPPQVRTTSAAAVLERIRWQREALQAAADDLAQFAAAIEQTRTDVRKEDDQ